MSEPDFSAIAARLAQPYAHLHGRGLVALPNRRSASALCDQLLNLLFPGFFSAHQSCDPAALASELAAFSTELELQVQRALSHTARITGQPETASAHDLAMTAINGLPGVLDLLKTDVEAAFHNDPAAIDRDLIILSYPCIGALAIQRFAHCLYRLGVPLLPRMLTEVAHSRTGIDIHPGAAIGESFFIDHGTGVVIGETCTIGRHCVLYQGVTLGAWNPTAKDSDGLLSRGQGNKRHPDLEDHVTVYAGATILGGTTRIGHHSVIGGKVWLTSSVDAYSIVMSEEPKLTIRKRKGAVDSVSVGDRPL